MKFPMACITCAIQHSSSSASLQLVGVRDDGRYDTVCQLGHKEAFFVQNPKFDILFEIGANAILDGYYREAVSSFQASLERCYEFFIRAVLQSKAMPDDVLAGVWKQVAKQSERQLGAFVLLYSMEFGRAPSLISNNRVKFRNEVIHAGRIPSRDEAIDYGQAVLDIERPLVRNMKKQYSKAVTTLTLQNMENLRKPDEKSIGAASLSTIVGFQVEDYVSATGGSTNHHARSLELALSELAQERAHQEGLMVRQ